MRGLHTVAWRGLMRRKARSLITAIAVTLGVANVFGVLVVNASIDRGVNERRRNFAGADAIAYPTEPKNYDSTLVPNLLPRLKKLPQVRDVGLSWGALLLDAPRGTETRYITGMSPVALEAYARPQLERGRLPRDGQSEIVLRRNTARMLHVGIGDEVTSNPKKLAQDEFPDSKLRSRVKIEPGTPRRLTFTVTGLISDLPGARGEGTNFTSLGYLWKVFEPDVANEAELILDDDVDGAQWITQVRTDFPKLGFDSPDAGPEIGRLLAAIKGMLAGTSTLALFVGAFLIYLTFSMAVVERTRLYGSFHALGASGRQVASAVLVEAFALGVLSTILGIGFGFGLANLLVRLVTRVVPVPVTSPSITTGALLGAILIGLAVTALGAAAPAVRAARLPPITAIRDVAATSRISRSWIVGAALVAASLVFALVGGLGINLLTTIASISLMAGAVFLVPVALGPLASVFRRVARRTAPGIGDVAVMHVTRERNRSAYTLALVMIVLAAILTLFSTNRSLLNVLDEWVDKRFGADLLLYGPNMDAKLQKRVAAVDGIDRMTPVDFGTSVRVTSPNKTTQNLVLIEPDSFFAIAGFPWFDGSDESARVALRKGGAVLVPSGPAQRMRWHRGDRLELSLGDRAQAFEIAGVYATFSAGPEVGIVGSVVDNSFFRSDPNRDGLYIDFEPGANTTSITGDLRRILDPKPKKTTRAEFRLGPTRGIEIGPYFAITGAEIKQRAHEDFGSFIRIFFAVVLIAAIVGIIGMANTLASSVLLRFRELGILQAVGATPRNVRRMILTEAGILTTAAFVLSLVLGTALSWMFTRGAASELGFPLKLSIPWVLIPELFVVAQMIAFIAAVLPARRASRMTPVEALRYE